MALAYCRGNGRISVMVQFPQHPDGRDELIQGYELHRDALTDIYSELAGLLTWEHLTESLDKIGLPASVLLLNRDRLRAAVYDYALFADRRDGQTLFERWFAGYRRQSSIAKPSVQDRLAEAMSASRFGVFEIEATEDDLALLVSDTLSGEKILVFDRLASRHWQAGDMLAARLFVLPGFAMFASEPLEAAVSPEGGPSKGSLSHDDQAKLQAAVIVAFAEALQAGE